MKSFSTRTDKFTNSIFSMMTKKALENNAINLSQGFPDFDGPEWIKEIASQEILKGHNQYAPFIGDNFLRQQLSRLYKKNYSIDYDCENEITVTNGATQAIFNSILALVDPGDEVIVFEPYYDSYIAAINLTGAVIRSIRLNPNDYSFNEQELKSLFGPKTKLLMLNSPHNPTGKVFSQNELEFIAKLCKKFDAYVLSDEVYEYLVYDNNKHIPMATIDGMKERTLTISSIGKTFSLTGWKVGWVATSNHLSNIVRLVHQYNTFSVCTPIQRAVGYALERIDDYLLEFKNMFQKKRDFFYNVLSEANFRPNLPQSTYFMLSSISHLTNKSDTDYCLELIQNKKIAAIPTSVFYIDQKVNGYIRFCFAKKDETLTRAKKQLIT